MKAQTVLIARIALGLVVAFYSVMVVINSATLVYVVSIERRITRLETLQGVTPGARSSSPSPAMVDIACDRSSPGAASSVTECDAPAGDRRVTTGAT